jgi:hypothetical protein
VAYYGTRRLLQSRTLATFPKAQRDNWYDPSLMDHMLFRIQECNKIPDDIEQGLLDFTVDGKVLGKVCSSCVLFFCVYL